MSITRSSIESELRRSEAHLAASQRIAHLGSWELDLSNLSDINANPLSWSDEVFRIFGYEPGSIPVTNESFFKAVHPDDHQMILEAVRRAVEDGIPYSIEHRVICPDGTEKILHEQSDIILDPVTGRPSRMIGTVLDVTERKRMEAKLKASEDGLRRLMDNLPDIIFRYRFFPERHIEYMSPAITRVLGYLPSETYAKPDFIFSLVHADDLAEMRSIVADGKIPSEPFNMRFRKKSGEIVWLENHLVEINDGDGRLVGFEGVARDITERVMIEQQMRQIQKVEALGRLSGGVAHDFNNILCVITCVADEILTKEGGVGPVAQKVREILRATDRATSLTRQLLAFSRKQMIAPRVVNLNLVIESLKSMLMRLIGEDVIFCTDLAPSLGNVRVDVGQMEQIIVNLAVNARDAMPKGGRFEIITRNIGSNQSRRILANLPTSPSFVEIEVSDTGTGIEPGDLDKLFEPFFTTKEKGTGLGLATVHGIVKQSGGHIDVDSKVGRGTTFRIYLPRVLQAVENPASKRQPALIENRGKAVILLVEDEDDLRAAEAEILRGAGYHVLEAENGQKAIDVLRVQSDFKIDLLVTDVVMPIMGGRQLAEQLTALFPSLRVLFLSGYTKDSLLASEGFKTSDQILNKPFTATELLKKVSQKLDTRRLALAVT